MSNSKNVTRPTRDPDYYSKRDVPYWWAPEWVRGTSSEYVMDEVHEKLKDGFKVNSAGQYYQPCNGYGKIHPVKDNGDVNLYMKSKTGNLSYIQGSIQKEFKKWHEDRAIDYLLLGMDPDEIIATE